MQEIDSGKLGAIVSLHNEIGLLLSQGRIPEVDEVKRKLTAAIRAAHLAATDTFIYGGKHYLVVETNLNREKYFLELIKLGGA